jgi:zinc protease
VGAALGGNFDRDRAGYTLRTLSSQRERAQAVATLAKIIQQPDFPAASLEREKNRVIAALREEDTQPESIAAKTFFQTLYGSHPYGLPPAGKPETVATLTRADVAAFYHARYTAGSAVISLIGDVSRAEAEAIAKELSASLPTGAADGAIPPAAQPAQAEQRTIAHPAKQSHILIGDIGVRRGDPDYFPLFVGNHVLGGGGFTSRLMQDVREKRGLAYSVYSYFEPLRQEGPFVIGLQTKREQTAQALEVVRDTLKEFVAAGPKAVELEKAKQNIVLGFPLRIDSNAKILGYLSLIGFYDLPLSYLDDFVRQVERVGVRDVKDAFARRVHPDRMVTVVVGGSE